MTTSSCCFSIMPGVVENIRKAVSRCPASLDWLAWNSAPSSSGHATPAPVSTRSSFCRLSEPRFDYRRCTVNAGAPPSIRILAPARRPIGLDRTFICVLPRKLGHGVSNLAAHRRVLLLSQTLQHACAYGLALGLVESQKGVGGLAVGRLPRLGGLSPEDDGGECACLTGVSLRLQAGN
jgi:hypothetical protein